MRRSLLALSIALALCPTVHAAGAGETPPPSADASVPLTYVGANARVSVGVNQDGDVQGEALGVFGDDGESAWIAQLWKGQGASGGVQFDYHWLLAGKTKQDTIDHPDSVRVAQAFVAFDQNRWKDRKATVGAGWVKDDFFVDGYLTFATSGTRFLDRTTSSITNTLSGTENGHVYTQTETITTVVDYFAHPYEHGIGVRLGQYFDDPLLRVRGGLDYEKGKFGADQLTVSVGLDKYIRNSGWSFSLEGEHLRKTGPAETSADKSDDRGWLLARYEFGQSFRPREPYRVVTREVAPDRPARTPPPAPPQVLRNEVKLDGDAFFDFDRSTLHPETMAKLDELIAKLKSGERVSRVSVVGHTCSIGTDAYNQALSERRAKAVRDYLVAHGVPADEIESRGEGERNPTYPNDTEASRRKNRRVDVEFLTVEETTVAPTQLPVPENVVTWTKEPVPAPAAWIERALRTPAEHKRTVDVYRFARTSTSTTRGDKHFDNRPPLAVDDKLQLGPTCPTSITLRVLDNDSDPDGDPLTITAVGAPLLGTVSINADGTLHYGPKAEGDPAYCDSNRGGEHFTYTIRDSFGATSTATVTILPPPPIVVDTNRAPVAVDDSVTLLKGEGVNINVLANDTDPDGDRLRVISVQNLGPLDAEITINADGTVRYQHIHGTRGPGAFRYTITDDHGHQVSATVNVFVTELPPGF